MKSIITDNDFHHLLGKFVIQVNSDDEYPDLRKNIDFYLEKRIKMVTEVYRRELPNLIVLAKPHLVFSMSYTKDEFIAKWNSWATEIGCKRHYRLMTKGELTILFNHLINERL